MIGRTNAGGGGGLQDTDALLRVQAPAGSVVTITKSGMTKTDHGHENADDHTVYDYYFIIHQSQFDSVNPWTVTATLDTISASKTIVVNAADEFDLVFNVVIPDEYQPVEYVELYGGAGGGFGYSFTTFTINALHEFGHYYSNSGQDNAIISASISTTGQVPDFVTGNNVDGTRILISSTSNGVAKANSIVSEAVFECLFADMGTNTALTLKLNENTYTGTSSNRVAGGLSSITLLRNTGGSSRSRLIGTTKIYTSTDTSALFAEFVPCYRISDSKGGFYERVSKTFITASSGTVSVGGNI